MTYLKSRQGLVNKGAWSSTATYVTGDTVSRAYSLYVALQGNTNADPATPLGTGSVGGTANLTSPSDSFQNPWAQPFTLNSTTTLTAADVFYITACPAGTRYSIVPYASIVGGTTVPGTETPVLATGLTGASATGYVLAVFDTPVTLTPGNYALVIGSGGATPALGSGGYTGFLSAPPRGAYYGANYGGANPGFQVAMRLYSATKNWDKIAAGGNQENANTVASATGTVTLPDVETATVHRLTLTGNTTLVFPPLSAGKSFTLELTQDATGGRTVTWPASVVWPGGTAPTLTSTASKSDVYSFLCTNGTNWRGFVAGQNYS